MSRIMFETQRDHRHPCFRFTYHTILWILVCPTMNEKFVTHLPRFPNSKGYGNFTNFQTFFITHSLEIVLIQFRSYCLKDHIHRYRKGTEKPHYSKSQIFVQKFNFDKTPTFSRVFHQKNFDNFSREIKVVNS